MGACHDTAAPTGPVSPIRFDSSSYTLLLDRSLKLTVAGTPARQLQWSVTSRNLDIERDGTVHGILPGDGWVFVSDGRSGDSALVRVRVRFTRVVAGSFVSCGVSSEGRGLCWGSNDQSALGDSTALGATSPHLVSGADRLESITIGGATVCGNSGTVICWGYNGVGQVGDGTTRDRVVPAAIADTLGLTSVVLGSGATSCANDLSGRVLCWGWNAYGQLLDGTHINWRRPIVLPVSLSRLTTGGGQICGLDGGGAAWCWGRNEFGQLGNGTTATIETPTPVTGGLVFAQLAAGREHTCGLAVGGQVFCWGHNDRGQLGRDDVASSSIPLPIASAVLFDTIATAAFHSCALAGGQAWCWGANDDGQLGRDAAAAAPAVLPVTGAPRFSAISTGLAHTCGMSVDNIAWCWGRNESGEIGDGLQVSVSVPTRVLYQP